MKKTLVCLGLGTALLAASTLAWAGEPSHERCGHYVLPGLGYMAQVGEICKFDYKIPKLIAEAQQCVNLYVDKTNEESQTWFALGLMRGSFAALADVKNYDLEDFCSKFKKGGK